MRQLILALSDKSSSKLIIRLFCAVGLKTNVPGVWINDGLLLVGVRYPLFCTDILAQYQPAVNLFLYQNLYLYYRLFQFELLWVYFIESISFPNYFLYTPFRHRIQLQWLNKDCITITRHSIKQNINVHWKILRIIILNCQECVVPDFIEITD